MCTLGTNDEMQYLHIISRAFSFYNCESLFFRERQRTFVVVILDVMSGLSTHGQPASWLGGRTEGV